MSKSIASPVVRELAAEWFNEYIRLAYWIGRTWTRRLLDWQGKEYAASDLEEYAQDAVARGYERFLKRCAKSICGKSDRKKWVCQCMVRACQDALRNKSRFGSVSDRYAVRDDATNRFCRVRPAARHGTDEERAYLDPEYFPVQHPVQQWELREVVRCLPEHLQDTAVYAAIGLTHADSALLQGCCERTVRNRLSEIREILDPTPNVYAIIVDALLCCMDKPRGRDGQRLLPILQTALAG
jgi:DNA-directed RNA polymerase specialized sigma24 family protein